MNRLAIAISIVLVQIALAMYLAKAADLDLAYHALYQWDSEWYGDIVERGYASYFPVPPAGQAKDNGGFFPGYPITARGVHLFFGLDTQLALLLVAQGAAVVFWLGLLRLLGRWRIQPIHQTLIILAVLAHPCSFYLVAAYAESLFCAGLVFMIYFSCRRDQQSIVGTTVAGFAMSATRIMGVAMAGIPFLSWCLRKRAWWKAGMITGIVSISGTLLFLIYCKIHFGDFTHYMKTQKEGWGVVPQYLAIFKPENYNLHGNDDRLAMSLTTIALALTAIVELGVFLRGGRRAAGQFWRIRLPWYLGVLALWYLASSGVASVSFRSLIRYSLPWTILLIIAWVHLFTYSIKLKPIFKLTALAWLAIGLTHIFCEQTLNLLNDYLHGQWVS